MNDSRVDDGMVAEAKVSFLEEAHRAGFELDFEMASGGFVRKRGIPVEVPRFESIGMGGAAFVMRLYAGSEVLSEADVESFWLGLGTQNVDIVHL